ncbi:MAG: hypothetical protein ACOX2F_04125 [bacterium]
MRKILWVVSIVLLLLFVSCGEKTKKIVPQDGENDITDSEEATDDDTADSGKDDMGNTGNTSDDASDTGNTGNTGDDGNTADSGDDGNTGNSGDDGNTGNTSDPCAKCDSENRICVEKDDKWICGKCKDDFYPDEDGLCISKGELGYDCDITEHNGKDCLSGKCVDGVCCDSDCDGLCESCNVSEFYKGKCTPYLAGTDPDNECDEEPAESCGKNGFCDGLGVCQKHSKTTQCKAPECSGNSSIEAAFCDGEGNCDDTNLNPTDCNPYTCDSTTGLCAGGTCSDDDGCVAGYYCSGSTCQAKKVNGNLCKSDNECLSGTCVLDDFNSDGLKYCVPSAPPHCVREGAWYVKNKTFCAPAGSTQYKKCDPDSWGEAINCPHTENWGCKPSDWATTSGYKNPDSCSDEVAGHKCNTDTECKLCQKMVSSGGTMTISVFIFNESTKKCYTDCVVGDFLMHDYCGSKDANSPTHYCAKNISVFNTGICKPRKKAGAACEQNYECLSNSCKTKKCQ